MLTLSYLKPYRYVRVHLLAKIDFPTFISDLNAFEAKSSGITVLYVGIKVEAQSTPAPPQILS